MLHTEIDPRSFTFDQEVLNTEAYRKVRVVSELAPLDPSSTGEFHWKEALQSSTSVADLEASSSADHPRKRKLSEVVPSTTSLTQERPWQAEYRRKTRNYALL